MDALVYVLTETNVVFMEKMEKFRKNIIKARRLAYAVYCKKCNEVYVAENDEYVEICEYCGVYQDCSNCNPAKFVEHDEELDCYEIHCVNCYEPHGHCG